jgi:hypothetical protein
LRGACAKAARRVRAMTAKPLSARCAASAGADTDHVRIARTGKNEQATDDSKALNPHGRRLDVKRGGRKQPHQRARVLGEQNGSTEREHGQGSSRNPGGDLSSARLRDAFAGW